MVYIIITFLSFLITVVSTPYLINYLTKKDILDKPNGEERRVHTEPIPRMGGIIIFLVIIGVTFAFHHDIYSRKFFITGAFLAFALGLIDDVRGIKWQIKFIVQSMIAVLLIFSLNDHSYTTITFLGYTLFPGLDYIVLFLLIVGLLNSFNLMDGMDGLVAGYSMIIASMCFLFSVGNQFIFLPTIAAAIIGTTLGFLKFNANPARIFLGDSGSLTLGYLISGLVITISGEATSDPQNKINAVSRSIDLTFIIIVFAIPIADTLRVMIVRLKQRKNPFLPDNNHLHHILYSKNIRHKTVVLIIHMFSIMFVLLAIYYAEFSRTQALIIYAVFLLLFFFISQVVDFIIRKEHLLIYGRLFKRIPVLLPRIYKRFLLPAVAGALMLLFVFLIIAEVGNERNHYAYFLIFLVPSLLYSGITLHKNDYYADILVLINLVLFFIITGLNGFFYKLYPLPLAAQININQIFIIVLTGMIIFFALFKERVSDIRKQFLTGSDLTIAVLIIFIYIAVQLLNIPESYRISDTLLRSFLVFIFYKIIITVKPQFHFPLYYSSYAGAALAVLISLF